MVKVDDFHVEFDQKWGVYSPGDIVTGSVDLKINDKYYCDSISAQCYGSARIWWIERQLSPPNGMRSVPYTQEKIYIDTKQNIWEFRGKSEEIKYKNSTELQPISRTTYELSTSEASSPSDAVNRLLRDASNLRLRDLSKDEKRAFLNPGSHSFPFSFQLPLQLPTSFDASGSGGCIRYFVKVQVKESEKCKVSKKGFFTVISPYNLNEISSASRAIVKNGQRICKGGGMFCMGNSGGKIGLTLTLQKAGYVPGEAIIVSAEFDNRSGRSIKGMKARLIQITTCYSIKPELKAKENSSCVALTANSTKIRRGELYLWDGLSFLVPAVNPTFLLDGLMEVEYRICIEAILGKSGPNLKVDAPIIIGTVPLRPVDHAQHQCYNNYYGEPPPAYEESVMGRSETQGNLIEDYIPRFGVYNTHSGTMSQPLIQ